MLEKVRRPSPGTVLGGLALIVAMSGAAVAAIPGDDGVVTACLSRDGELRVIDAEAGRACKSGKEKKIRLASTDSTGKVANADKLDGKNSTDFLTSSGPIDADTLDGKDSTDFLGANAKAADSDKLDGKDSGDFVAQSVTRLGPVTEMAGNTSAASSFAGCQAGEVVLGGGYLKGQNINIHQNVPGVLQSNNDPIAASDGQQPTGWTVVATRFDMNITDSFQAYVVCG